MKRSLRRLIFLAIALVAVLVAAVIWRHFASREPGYEGRPLSSWLQQMVLSELNKNPVDRDKAAEAVRQIGPAALPVLLTLLRAEDPGPGRRVAADAARECAVAGYEALGPAARRNIPELCQVLTNHVAPYARRSAARALGFIGVDSDGAVGALLKGTKDGDEWVRNYSLWALSRVPADPGLVVPALIDSLNDPFPPAHEIAAIALGGYGPRARAAVPALLGARATNKAAALALVKIDAASAFHAQLPGAK